ncbi:hypothetical protein Tco_0397683 [Tanacetum coccineum]
MVLLGSVPDPEVEAVLEYTNLESMSVKLVIWFLITASLALMLLSKSFFVTTCSFRAELVRWSLVNQGLINQRLINLALINRGLVGGSLVVIISPVLVVTVLAISLVLLNGRKTGRSNLISNRGSVTGISLIEISCRCLSNKFLNIVTINVAIGGGTILVRMSTTTSNTTFLDRFDESGSLGLVFLLEK